MDRIRKNIISLDRKEINKILTMNDSNEKCQNHINEQMQEEQFSKLSKKILKTKNLLDEKLKTPLTQPQNNLMTDDNAQNHDLSHHEIFKKSFKSSLMSQTPTNRVQLNKMNSFFPSQINNAVGVHDNDPLNHSDLDIEDEIFNNISCKTSQINQLENTKNKNQTNLKILDNNQFPYKGQLQRYRSNSEQNRNFLNMNSNGNHQIITNSTTNCINTNIQFSNGPISYTNNNIYHNFFTKTLSGVPNLFNSVVQSNTVTQNQNINLSDRIIIPFNQNVTKPNSFGVSSYFSSGNSPLSFLEQRKRGSIQQNNNYLVQNGIITKQTTRIQKNFMEPIINDQNFTVNNGLFLENKNEMNNLKNFDTQEDVRQIPYLK